MPNKFTWPTFRESTRLTALVCGTALLTSGCLAPTATDGKAAGAIPTPATAAPELPGDTVVVCLDASSSYGRVHRRAAKETVADALPDLVRPGRGTHRVYVYEIGENSYRRPPLLSLAVPELRRQPSGTPASAPPLQDGLIGERLKKVADDWKAERRDARRRAGVEAEKIRGLRLADREGTDIGGCLENAAEQFTGHKGGRRLVIASDLRAEGEQQEAAARLDDVAVDVIEFACAQARTCDELRNKWTKRFTELGARSVNITRPGVPAALFASEAEDQ